MKQRLIRLRTGERGQPEVEHLLADASVGIITHLNFFSDGSGTWMSVAYEDPVVSVLLTAPPNGMLSVPINIVVSVAFTERINTKLSASKALNAYVRLLASGTITEVAASNVDTSPNKNILNIRSLFTSANVLYQVTIDGSLPFEGDRRLEKDYTFCFST